ncbi:MAG: Mini-ribonuclease 3 [Clostridia bacterium]|nr:Mini-ribonuclease 3 [Clostridia bacterium]
MMFDLSFSKKPEQYSPLVLAYIGDCVYEIYVRTRVVSENPNLPAHMLHRRTIEYVKAHSQSVSMHMLLDKLTEKETAIYKRGRNAKSATMPKNANLIEYRQATGFEALLGFLYLKGDESRLEELMRFAYENALN